MDTFEKAGMLLFLIDFCLAILVLPVLPFIILVGG